MGGEGREETVGAPSVAKLPPHLKGCKTKSLSDSNIRSKPCQIMRILKKDFVKNMIALS